MRILVIEDEPIAQKIANAVLENLGHVADIVQDGASALALLTKKSYDMIFVDLELPEISGKELIREIRSRPQYELTPVVALSAHNLTKEHFTAEEAVSAIIQKPLTTAAAKRVFALIAG